MPGAAEREDRRSAPRPSASNGYAPEASPVVFWDLYGKAGHPVRTTVSEIGPTLLGRILELNDTQSGVLEIAFKLADDRGLLLLDLDDLRALLALRRREPQGDLDRVRPRQRAVGRGDSARAARRWSARAARRCSASRRSSSPI